MGRTRTCRGEAVPRPDDEMFTLESLPYFYGAGLGVR